MNINIKLDKNFTTVFNKLKEENGEKMCKLNGFSDTQLNYTDFIDNFVDKNNVANASIDANANVGVKDVSIPKPFTKFFTAYSASFWALPVLVASFCKI